MIAEVVREEATAVVGVVMAMADMETATATAGPEQVAVAVRLAAVAVRRVGYMRAHRCMPPPPLRP